MTMRRCGSFVLAGAVVAATAPLSAHHASAPLFDQTKTIELQGAVKVWRLSNPHPLLILEVADAKGEKVECTVSFGNAAGTALRRRGWTPETIKVGEVVMAKGNPARAAGTCGIDGASLTRADGRPVP